MPAYDFVALTETGKKEKGVIAADSARAARKELRLRALTPIRVDEAKAQDAATSNTLARSSLNESERILVTRQLAMLIGAGTPVEEALSAVSSQMDRPASRKTMMAVRSSVTEGYRLAEALAEHPKAFPELYRSIVGAGESSGDLGAVLDRLATYQEKARKVRQKVLAALIYPIMLSLVAIAVIVALLVFVVPQVVGQFESFNQDLPPLTSVMLAISGFLSRYGLILLVAVPAAIFLLARGMGTGVFRKGVDGFLLKVPVIGRMIRQINAARFSRTLSTLMGSGAPVLDSLAAARGSLTNERFQRAVGQIMTAVKEGGSMSRAMKASGVFPPLLVNLAASGEASGQLPMMLNKGAEFLEDEFETSSGIALGLLEPLIIVTLGGVVALVVLSIMLPILQLNSIALG